jgi:hypothetical protein
MKHQSSSDSLSSSPSSTSGDNWKKSIVYRPPSIDMSNLTILATTIALRFEEFVSVKSLLDSAVLNRRERNASLGTYIQLACAVYTLGRGIVKSWTPVAQSCCNEVLRQDLLDSLVRVETLSVGLKTVIAVQRRSEDWEGDGVFSGVQGVVKAVEGAVRGLEVAKVRIL